MRAFVPYRFVIVALAAALLLLTSSVSYATHLRPKGATPDLDALVISYKDCTAPGTHTHGMTGLPSCAPPTPTSQWLEVGDPVANGNPASFIGSNRLDVCPVPGCAAPDVRFETRLQDVRCASAALPASVCPTGLHGLYTGEVAAVWALQITDHCNWPQQQPPLPICPASPGTAATVVEFPLRVTIPCGISTTAGTCRLTGTWSSLIPIVADQKMNIRVDPVVVTDGGADGDPDTAPNDRYAVEGLFVP